MHSTVTEAMGKLPRLTLGFCIVVLGADLIGINAGNEKVGTGTQQRMFGTERSVKQPEGILFC